MKPKSLTIPSPFKEMIDLKNKESINNEIISKSVQAIILEKERLVKERIKILTGEEIDLISELRRTFPRITGKHSFDNLSESYYWNDGSDEGKLLITFYPIKEEYNFEPRTVKCNFGFRYK